MNYELRVGVSIWRFGMCGFEMKGWHTDDADYTDLE